MLHHIYRITELAAALGTLSSIAFYLLCIWSAAGFLRESKSKAAGEAPATTHALPPASILKPLKGTDPGMYESLRSHCVQDYPEYEIIFGVSDPNDLAIALVTKLQAEFPQRLIRLVVCEQDLGANTKVSNLAQMLPRARYEYLIVNDSDIRVESDYLCKVVPPLTDPAVGMVTCLYRAVASPTLGSRLESLGISTDFIAGVLAARQLEGIHFGLGSTLAFRRRDLQAMGGFEALADYLADDYELGSRIAARGLKVILSDSIVETFLPAYGLGAFLDHQLRWARTIRDSRRWGYLGLGLTFGLPWAMLTVVLSQGTAWAWALLGAVCVVRAAMALIVGRSVLRDRQVPQLLWLIPLRDVIALFVWLASFAGHTISWRDETFMLAKGKLTRTES
jgi:ceramide glucosyltransferase